MLASFYFDNRTSHGMKNLLSRSVLTFFLFTRYVHRPFQKTLQLNYHKTNALQCKTIFLVCKRSLPVVQVHPSSFLWKCFFKSHYYVCVCVAWSQNQIGTKNNPKKKYLGSPFFTKCIAYIILPQTNFQYFLRFLQAPVPAAPAPGVHATQYHAQDEFGNVIYGYSNPNSAKTEQRDAYGNVVGAYSYDDGTGYPKHVSYVADDFGFRITSANNLPVAHVQRLIK